ncbi:MAG TPA: hypothetical protein VGP26_12905 [Actinophytocola sp.]|nr:hypothetical protein [Actinophytocola sp.]
MTATSIDRTSAATELIQIFDPVSPRRSVAGNRGAARIDSLEGKRIGLLHNGKPGGEHMLAGIRLALAQRYPDATFDFRFKPHASVGANFLDELTGVWDAAVIAVGDCGSCSSYAVHDGTELEKRGIPSVVFVSSPFEDMSRLWARRLEVPDLAILVVGHPLAQLPATVLADEWGAPRTGEVVDLLTGAH